MPSLSKVGSEMLDGALPAISGASLTNLDARDLENALPAISGASLTGIDGGDKRNFIINGNMSQHPDGDTTDFNGSEYVCALWQAWANQDGQINASQDSSVVPTVAQSDVSSAYSLKLDVTTADASIAAGHYYGLRYHITGSDFALLHQQQVTLAFWVYATKTGTYCCSFQNSASDRSYPVEYTVSSSNTWEYKTITLTLDSSGTWLDTEADKGMTIFWMLSVGSTFHGTNASWQAGTKYGTSSQVNAVDSTSNFFYLSQVGLYLGSSAPTFTSPPISTVKGQIEYYVEVRDHSDGDYMFSGQARSSSEARGRLKFNTRKRTVPTLTWKTGSPQALTATTTAQTGTGNSFSSNNEEGAFVYITGGSGLVAGNASILAANGTSQLLIDSRH